MTYRLDTKENGEYDIVIDGFENGIADSPHLGIADMRNINIESSIKDASIEFSMEGMIKPPTVTGLAFTVETTDIFTVANTTGWYNGMAIFLSTLTGGTGLVVNKVYYIGDLTATTFKLYKDFSLLSAVIDVTVAGSGTLTSYTFGNSRGQGSDQYSPELKYTIDPTTNYVYVIDKSGFSWFFAGNVSSSFTGLSNNTIYFLGNTSAAGVANTSATTSTGSYSFGICYWKGYILLFWGTGIDYVKIDSLIASSPADKWVYAWEAISAGEVVPSLVGSDDRVYFGLGNKLGSLSQVVGKTFNPTDSTTYNLNQNALDIPSDDIIISLGQLGTDLLVGGKKFNIYPWDRISPSFNFPLVVGEQGIRKIVSTNSNAYIFAGNRGRIYITNGANIEEWKKIPDSISGKLYPYYTWGDAIYSRNKLYFSFYAESNDGTNLDNTAGLWEINLATGALRMSNKPSYAGYTGFTLMVAPNLSPRTPSGISVFTAWASAFLTTATYGGDAPTTNPYVNGEAYIETELVPVGTFLNKKTFENVEFKLSKALVAGESVKMYARKNLSDSYTEVPITQGGGTGEISGIGPINFQDIESLQIKVELYGTVTTPSYVPLREIRIR